MPPDPLTLSAAEQARNVAIPMMTERGRGLVLVGTARLDLALEHVLKAVMAPCSDPDDKLFTPDRSLGSYGAKINLAARLGLIDASIEQALHVIRRVRNDFAHSAGEPSLTEPRHQTRLQRVYSEAERSPPCGIHRSLRTPPTAFLASGHRAFQQLLSLRLRKVAVLGVLPVVLSIEQ